MIYTSFKGASLIESIILVIPLKPNGILFLKSLLKDVFMIFYINFGPGNLAFAFHIHLILTKIHIPINFPAKENI